MFWWVFNSKMFNLESLTSLIFKMSKYADKVIYAKNKSLRWTTSLKHITKLIRNSNSYGCQPFWNLVYFHFFCIFWNFYNHSKWPHKLLDFCKGLCIQVWKFKLVAKILIFIHVLCLCSHIHVSFCL